jgi:hypothetical protein
LEAAPYLQICNIPKLSFESLFFSVIVCTDNQDTDIYNSAWASC